MGAPDYGVDFPTLWVVPYWIERHCPIPDGFNKGRPFVLVQWQLDCVVNHYRVKPDAPWIPEAPVLGGAFHSRQSLIVGVQKLGKGPLGASVTANEGVGPALFAGFAGKDEGYVCREHGCGCGWEYPYDVGEPRGMPWPTPLIQLTATSADQVQNIYRPLKAMVRGGPLADMMRVTDTFIDLPDDGRIDVVTASATSRLGAPLTFFIDDETGLYTRTNKLHGVYHTQDRGSAAMGGRGIQMSNCWDPSQLSIAQETYEAAEPDVFVHYRQPPIELSFEEPADRRQILEYNYAGSVWALSQIDTILAKCNALMKTDPAQAMRFFGNMIVQGEGQWMPDDLWANTLLVEEEVA